MALARFPQWKQQAAVFPRNRAALNSPIDGIKPPGPQKPMHFRANDKAAHLKKLFIAGRYHPGSPDRDMAG
jgi:hypothetical protein